MARIAGPKNLREIVYTNIRRRIESGHISFEDRIVDYDLASEFGVSRGPVREALRQLVTEGLLEGTSRGYVLPRPSSAEIGEIFEIRLLLEPRAAELAAARKSPKTIRGMSSALDQARVAHSADRTADFISANAAFRTQWVGLIPNSHLAEVINHFFFHIQAIRLETLASPVARADALEGMERIYNAFVSGDQAAARNAVLDQLDHAWNAILQSRERSDVAAKSSSGR